MAVRKVFKQCVLDVAPFEVDSFGVEEESPAGRRAFGLLLI
jgi:hypothetical protein